jgi:hypothetical protein
MSKMIELVEQMRARMNEIADTEHGLVRALGEALSRVDQKLLHEVFTITAEHEARRGAILGELQGLASRIGAFPSAREPFAEIAYDEPKSAPSAPANDARPAFPRGDWREAANNIQDELYFFCKGRGSSH